MDLLHTNLVDIDKTESLKSLTPKNKSTYLIHEGEGKCFWLKQKKSRNLNELVTINKTDEP